MNIKVDVCSRIFRYSRSTDYDPSQAALLSCACIEIEELHKLWCNREPCMLMFQEVTVAGTIAVRCCIVTPKQSTIIRLHDKNIEISSGVYSLYMCVMR